MTYSQNVNQCGLNQRNGGEKIDFLSLKKDIFVKKCEHNSTYNEVNLQNAVLKRDKHGVRMYFLQ